MHTVLAVHTTASVKEEVWLNCHQFARRHSTAHPRQSRRRPPPRGRTAARARGLPPHLGLVLLLDAVEPAFQKSRLLPRLCRRDRHLVARLLRQLLEVRGAAAGVAPRHRRRAAAQRRLADVEQLAQRARDAWSAETCGERRLIVRLPRPPHGERRVERVRQARRAGEGVEVEQRARAVVGKVRRQRVVDVGAARGVEGGRGERSDARRPLRAELEVLRCLSCTPELGVVAARARAPSPALRAAPRRLFLAGARRSSVASCSRPSKFPWYTADLGDFEILVDRSILSAALLSLPSSASRLCCEPPLRWRPSAAPPHHGGLRRRWLSALNLSKHEAALTGAGDYAGLAAHGAHGRAADRGGHSAGGPAQAADRGVARADRGSRWRSRRRRRRPPAGRRPGDGRRRDARHRGGRRLADAAAVVVGRGGRLGGPAARRPAGEALQLDEFDLHQLDDHQARHRRDHLLRRRRDPRPDRAGRADGGGDPPALPLLLRGEQPALRRPGPAAGEEGEARDPDRRDHLPHDPLGARARNSARNSAARNSAARNFRRRAIR